MENYINTKVHQCMEEWKSSPVSMREVIKKYFWKIADEIQNVEKQKAIKSNTNSKNQFQVKNLTMNQYLFFFFSFQILLSEFLFSQNPDVNYVAGSTQKIEQLIGDWEFQYQQPTTNLTNTNYQLARTDLGVPFQHNGKTYILFGDSQGGHPGDLDCVAYTTDTNPDNGLVLTFLTDINGIWNPIIIPTVNMGTFNVPTEGVSRNGNIYLYSTTDSMTQSVVSVSNDDGYTYQKLYDWSTNHFINVSIVEVNLSNWNGFPLNNGPALAIFGSGTYRASDMYFAYQHIADIGTQNDIYYFAGLNANGNPMWTSLEANAAALFNQPCVGEFSVTYNQFIKKWLMTYNCYGTNFRTADNPWGPWSEPKVLFDEWADNGYCYFIHVNWNYQVCDSAFDPGRDTIWGISYGPYQFPEYATSTDSATNTTIYFTQSTWNPYTVILMKSTLQLSQDTLFVNAPSCSANPYSITLNWTGSGIGWWIHISTDPNFATFQSKNVDNFTSTSAPAGFSGGLTLYPDSIYYWRLFKGAPPVLYGTSFKVPDCNASPTSLQIINSACADSAYTDTIKWTGAGVGWWIDISTDSTFAFYSNKNVDNLTSTVAPAGFSAGLTLLPNTTYYWRMWNGIAWTYGGSFNVPNCVTGIEETAFKNSFSVYPNPFSETTTLQITNARITNYELKIFDVMGKIVFHSKLQTPNSELDLKDLPNGIYFLQIQTSEWSQSSKLVKVD